MTKRRHAPKFLIHATLIAFVHSGLTGAAEINDLEDKLRAIASEAQGKVGVACSLPGTVLKCNLNADTKSTMQSVFKLLLALTVLHQVEQGSLALDDTIHFRPDDRILPHTYSPLQEKYPNAEVDVSLRELLRLAVALSDNVAADILLRSAGGPKP